ncbi:glycosyltransferase family 4 protein [Metabacillus herbersteinensis]|uniref:Glycosyltransferase family 4 protein n=1 Tax=Metabacillus herbersteinensis TaxID=283816 RepID=A0ABV6GEX7_9BACI
MLNGSVILAFFASLITVLIVTPLVIKFAIRIGATDEPNSRKVHHSVMPRLGGLAIFIGVIVGYITAELYNEKLTAIIIGSMIIIMTGILDDKYELSAKLKLLGQLSAAVIVVASGLTVSIIEIPFVGVYDLGVLSYPVTILWIIAITNAINLIDGLDGLAAGISTIAITTIAIMAMMNGKMLILTLSLIILGSTLGFLYYNFNPAKIFMGDTGALFLGYSISILSLLGLYKSVTLFSFVVPILILGVPIFDTIFAILRRWINKKPISAPDKGHLHHRLISIGLTHKRAVLLMYGLGALFSVSALIFSTATLWGALIITFALLIFLELIAEAIGLIGSNYRPMLNLYRRIVKREF